MDQREDMFSSVPRHLEAALRTLHGSPQHFEDVGRAMAVCSMDELQGFLKKDEHRWNVISIRDPGMPAPAALALAADVLEVAFYDVEEAVPWQTISRKPPQAEDITAILHFADRHSGEPILVHCLLGLCRSPAVAMILLIQGLLRHGWSGALPKALADRAVACLLKLRPRALPNRLVLRLGLERLVPAEIVPTLLSALHDHPDLVASRARRMGGDSA
jgi:predicted protein tyrosine phosphatase